MALYMLRYREPVGGWHTGLLVAETLDEAELIGRRYCAEQPRGLRGGTLIYVGVESAILADVKILGETAEETLMRRAAARRAAELKAKA